MIVVLISALALAGLVIAVYFTLAYYGRVKKARWAPEILCAPEGSSCVAVVATPYARVFGMPNSLVGIVYYLTVVGWAVAGQRLSIVLSGAALSLLLVLIAASALAVILGFYLIYALRRKLRTDCPLCYAAHAINAALLVLLLFVD